MSSFLINLVRRGAGLPATMIQAPPSPFGPEIGKQGDGLAEELATGNTASQIPLRASSSKECMKLPSEAPTHHTPFMQRLSGTESGTPIQPAARQPEATPSTAPLGPTPTSQGRMNSNKREEVITETETEIDVERGRYTPSSAAQEIGPSRHASSRAFSLPIIIEEPDERLNVAQEELSADRPRDGARKMPEPPLPTPTIRAALTEPHVPLQFPKTTPASSPTAPSQLPIHVRIGRVEVRETTAPTPAPARPSAPAPLGFDGYYRVRNYRS
jgi:hypothetical protein